MNVFLKYVAAALCFLCIVVSCSSVKQNQFNCELEATAFPNVEVVLEELDINKVAVIAKGTTDSLGYIKFIGVFNEPHLCRLRVGDAGYIYLMLDAKNIKLQLSTTHVLDAKISGSPRSEQLQNFLNEVAKINKSLKINELSAEKRVQNGTDTLSSLQMDKDNKALFSYISSQMDTVTSLPLALLYANFIDISQYPIYLRKFTHSLTIRFPNQQATVEKYNHYFNTTYTKYVGDKQIIVDSLAFTNILNKPFRDFTIPDFEGTPVNTAHFTDKYIVMQFLSAEIEGSRNANKHLNNAYQQLKDYPVQFLSIYIENDSAKWVDAAIADNLPWPQLSTLKSWNCPVATSLNIVTLPTVLVVDDQHKIIAANWSTQEIIENIKANTEKIMKTDTLSPKVNNN